MADNPLIVELLKEYKNEALLTRPEVGEILGLSRGTVAGICNRNSIKPWPQIPDEIKEKRDCQFPIGYPGDPDFHLCDEMTGPTHSFLCTAHVGKVWEPSCKILHLREPVLMLPRPAPGIITDRVVAPEATIDRGPKPQSKIGDSEYCQWPLAASTSLKEPSICAKPATSGLCEKHLEMIRKRSFSRMA